jgi:hypothetical protein
MPDPYIRELGKGSFPGNFGFRIGGSCAGPTIVVAGATALTTQVFQRLLLLPTLSRLKGMLYLIHLDKLDRDADFEQVHDILPAGTLIDGQMFLPFVNIGDMSAELGDSAVQDAYFAILRLCADHGMIAGRGIPARVAIDDTVILWRSSRTTPTKH